MKSKPEFIVKLQELSRLAPDLLQDLRTATTEQEAADKIIAAGGRHGITLEHNDVHDFLAVSAQQARIIATVHELIQADPALAETLGQASDQQEAMAAIMAAAERQGVSLDAGHLMPLDAVRNINLMGELDDVALEDVTGGVGVLLAGALLVSMVGLAGTVGLGALAAICRSQSLI
ncbi:hypothetical protein [Castellaniella sp.]|uniref:hypothetical protein n=1 Tax=Castellaniella sp. TaxID=1955812 RepID=UPI0035650EBF